jgi:two-component system, sporulation sensor kinase E
MQQASKPTILQKLWINMNRWIRLTLILFIVALVSFSFYFIIFFSNTKDANSVALRTWDYRWGEAPQDSGLFLNWLQDSNRPLAWQPIAKPSNPKDRGKQNEMWLRTLLPLSDIRDPSLYLQIFEHYEVYSKDRLIYSYGNFEPKQRDNYPGTPLRVIKLPDDVLGQQLYIHVYSYSKDIGIVNEPLLGSQSGFILKLLHSGAERFSFGFLYFVCGLLFMIIALFLSRHWVFVSFSLFLSFYGLYSICQTPIIYLFFDFPMVLTYTELISLYIWVGAMLSFVEQMFGAGYYKIIRRLWQLTILYMVFSLLAIFFEFFTIPKAVIVYQVIILISVIAVLANILHKAFKGNREAGVFFIGLALVSASGLFDIFKYLFLMTSTTPNFTHLSILMFIGILLYLIVNRLLKLIVSMKQAEKMAVVGQMAATVAHEIRNPMTVISGFLQLNRKDIQNPSHFTSIMSEIDRINELISNFLLFSNPTEIKYTEHSLQDILEETVILFQPMLMDGSVQIELEMQESIPVIHCDRNKIKQVLINIIKNAIEATASDGKIYISLAAASSHTVHITISDQGSGIPPEHLKRIWEPFFTTKQSGTGLGLMVSLKIIELHHGHIHVQSKKQEGTTFIIELPFRHQWINDK